MRLWEDSLGDRKPIRLRPVARVAILLPGRILASGKHGDLLVMIGGRSKDRSPCICYELIAGAWGSRPALDGNDALHSPIDATSNLSLARQA